MTPITVKVAYLANYPKTLADGTPCPGLCYAHANDSGFDLRAAVAEPVTVEPRRRTTIPSGIKLEIPPGYELQIRTRSGSAHHYGMQVLNSPGTIDNNFRGEIGIILINHGDEPFVIHPGERIAQGVLAPFVTGEFEETDEAALTETSRGAGRFNSTGRS